MRYYVIFGLISIVLLVLVLPAIYNRTDWNPYAVWIAGFSAVALIVYGLDKALSTVGNLRAPENILHLLALLGGFPGAWAGMLVFHHKSNLRKHPGIWAVLLLSTLAHLALTYYWFGPLR